MTTVNRYKYQCSCCGAAIPKSEKHLIKDNEGNHCQKCSDNQELEATLQLMDSFEKIAESLNPMNRFRFNSMTFEQKFSVWEGMIEDGIITFSVK